MVNSSKTWHKPFRVDENAFRNLDKILSEVGVLKRITIRCADGLERRLSSIEELIGYDNQRSKNIQGIDFEYQGCGSAKLSLQGEWVYGMAETQVNLSGEEQTVIQVLSKIENELENSSPPYKAFCAKVWQHGVPFGVSMVVISLVLVLFVIGLILSILVPDDLDLEYEPGLIFVVTITWVVSSLGLFVTAGRGLRKFQSWLFPTATFRVGRETSYLDSLEEKQKTVVRGSILVVLTLIATLLVSWWMN